MPEMTYDQLVQMRRSLRGAIAQLELLLSSIEQQIVHRQLTADKDYAIGRSK